MEFLYEWKFWLFVLTIIGIIINWLSNQKLVKNDLKHLATDVTDIKSDVTHVKKKIVKNCKDIAYIKGKLDGKNN